LATRSGSDAPPVVCLVRCGRMGLVLDSRCREAKVTRHEVTGTRPDYLVNHDGQKLRGRSGEKIVQKSRNSCPVNDQKCGCIGSVDSRRNFAHF